MTLRGSKIAIAGLALASTLALGGCYDDGYGYSGVSVGYGTGGYYGYDSPYYDGYGYPGYGWYDDFYYPGTGYYVFDRGGRRHRWTDSQRQYWQSQRGDRNNHRGQHDGNGQRPPPGTNDRPRWQGNTPRGTPDRGPQQGRPDGLAPGQGSIRRMSEPRATAPAPVARPDRSDRGGRSDRGRRDNR